MKFKITATVPVTQYGNLSPEIEVEADSFEDAQAFALPKIEAIWAKYCEPGKELKPRDSANMAAGVSLETLESSLTGGKAYFDPAAHIYTNQFGHKFLSGSEFAEKFSPGFNADMILPKMEAKYGVPAKEIKAMWKAKADASCSIGDAIHKALELYGKYELVGLDLDKDKKPEEKKWSHIHDNPILNLAVQLFFQNHEDENAIYEGFVVNNDAMLCGSIDRLLLTGEKTCRVQDFKTNADLAKKDSPKFLSAPFTDLENTKLNKYWLQLSFYAHILALAGWTVEGLDIFHYDGKTWNKYSHGVIDISGAAILQSVKQQ
jgi:hypothetical protein